MLRKNELRKDAIRRPKVNKKHESQFKKKGTVTDKEQRGHSNEEEIDSRGKISSLFHKNPEIPKYASRAVKPVSEPVFSSQFFKDLSVHPFSVSRYYTCCCFVHLDLAL